MFSQPLSCSIPTSTTLCSRQESNLHYILRKDVSYPLNDESVIGQCSTDLCFFHIFLDFSIAPLPCEGHDWGVMSRGNSIIAGVVLIGVLGTLSIALQATTPATESFTYVTPVQQNSQVAATTATTEKAAEPAKMGCFEGFKYTAKTIKGDIQTSCTRVTDGCAANWGSSPFTAEDYKKAGGTACVPVVEESQKQAPNQNKPPCKQLPADKCDLEVCVGDKCSKTTPTGDEKNFSPKEELLKDLINKAPEDADAAKALEELQKQNPNMTEGINNAFKEQIAEQEDAVKQAQTDLDKLRQDCFQSSTCGSAEDQAAAKLKLETEKRKLAEMKAMQSRLAAAQTALEPKDKPCTGAGCSGGGGLGNGAGGGGSDSGNGQGSQRPPSTFPGMGQGGGQGGGQGQNQNNNPYQQCNPQYFCINSTLYWGNTQQNANTYYGMNNAYGNNSCQTQVVQRCQHGCQGNACAPAPQDDPQKAPVATLTCGEDKPYDVGMDVPLRFTCTNSETSKGSGFSTGNKMNSSTTVEIKKPPPGADVVSYGLTCVAQGGRTDSARCDVKINVPSIVIVANPKEVARNASTTIGWITQGMNSCTISSPGAIAGSALEEFNDDNKDNTSVSGVAVTPGLEDETTFKLSCDTKAGGNKEATIKVKVQ